MTLNKYFIFALASLICSFGISQTNIRFLDNSRETLVGVKTFVYNNNSNEILLRSFSDAQGEIQLTVEVLNKLKQVRINASLFGYKEIDTLLEIKSTLTLVLSKDIQSIGEVVVTAQYGEQLVENSVHNVTIIDRKKIDAIGAVSLKDVLTNEMGVRLSQDNVLGSSMTLQGVSGENVKILIDGVPVVGRLNGNVDLSQINLQTIERIEIIEGPLSVNYGTNALAGVINLISKKHKKKELNGNIFSYNESIGHYNLNTELNFGIKNHGFGLSGGRNFFNGWKDTHPTFTNPKPIADSTRFVTWNPKEQIFGGAYYNYRKNDWFFSYKINAFTETVLNRGLPRPPYLETAFDDKYYTQRIDNAISLRKKTKKGALNFIGSYNRYNRIKNTYFIDLTTLEQQLTGNNTEQDTSLFDQWMSRGTYTSRNDSSKINYQLGYDVLMESATGARIQDNRQTQGDFALFVTTEVTPFKTLILKPGIRYAYNTTYETPILPSLNLKWKLGNNWNIRASYARGFRAPGIKELYFEFDDINHKIFGNDQLIAETSQNYFVSLKRKSKHTQFSILSEVNGFYNDISNQISLASIDAFKFSYVNIGEFQSNGIKIKNTLTNKLIRSTIGFGLIGRRNRFNEESIPRAFLYYPEIQSSIIFSLNKKRTTLSLFYKYQGELPSFSINTDGEVYEAITDDYHWMDVTASHTFWKKRCTITTGIKNVLGITQIASNSPGGVHSGNSNVVSVGAGRTYFLSLKINFKKSLKIKQQ